MGSLREFHDGIIFFFGLRPTDKIGVYVENKGGSTFQMLGDMLKCTVSY